MKVFLIGSDWMQGISKKTQRPYDIGNLYAAAKLDPTNPNARGHMGATYECASSVAQSIQHIPHSISNPLEVELEIEDVMRYGQKRSIVVAVKPIQLRTAVDSPKPSTAK